MLCPEVNQRCLFLVVAVGVSVDFGRQRDVEKKSMFVFVVFF